MDKRLDLYSRQASTWFKGIAIIMVVLSHFAEWWLWFFKEEGTRELIRDGISRCGPYGVAIFFLFSGYGLAKSAGDERIDWRFVAKRFVNVYIPYLVTVSIIKLLSGGFDIENARDFGKFLYGDDFWYMTVLFSFYLAFMVIWFAFANRHVRAALICIFTYWYINYLYVGGAQEFWFLSNTAFAIGAVLALYEPLAKKVFDRIGILMTVLFGIGSVLVVRSALFIEHLWMGPSEEIRSRFIAVTVFTLFIVCFAAVWKWYDPVIPVFGRYSLHFYLLNHFLFMWAVNTFEMEMKMRFLMAAGIIVVAAIVLGIVKDILLKPLQKLLKKKV